MADAIIEDVDEADQRRGQGRPPMTGRVEVITGVSRQRRFTDSDKLKMLREAVQPSLGMNGVGMNAVARKYVVTSGQLYTWRKKFRIKAAAAARERRSNVGRTAHPTSS